MSDTLTALDATFLELEELDEGALMSIGGVMVFEPLPGGGVPTVEEVRADLKARLASLPRYSQRLSSSRTGRFAWPHWVDDERFDIGEHVHRVALPAPGGESELCAWAADFYSHKLDRTRPLWEMAVIEGLEHGRWAIAHKTHHCLVDGVGSVDVAYLLLDADPHATTPAPLPAAASDRSTLDAVLEHSPQPFLQAAHAGASAARGAVHSALHPRDAFARSRELATLLLHDEVMGAPKTSLNCQIGPTRRFAVAHVALADARRVREALGGSVNDVVLAASTCGLRSLLMARGDDPPRRRLRAMVPMNVRQTSERLALGNRVSSLFVDLPVAEPDPRVRYREIMRSTARLKASGAARAATAIIDLGALAPPALHATIARSLYATRLFNVTITNVPGPQMPLYSFGARLLDVHPVVPLAADHGVGIAIFSYDGMLTFGVIADAQSTPDIHVLRDGIAQGLEELVALADGMLGARAN